MYLSRTFLLLCLLGYLTLSTPRILEATVGGILVVKCQYGVDDEGYGKFWCRGATWQDCARVIETEQLAEEEVVRRGRVTLRHIPSQRSFQVIVVDLEEGDAGTYWCGVDKPGSGPQAPVAVTVFPGCSSLKGPTEKTGTPGSSLRVHCQYDAMYKGHNKYWCRGQHDTSCDTVVETKGEEKEERRGRVPIKDYADDLTFTVTMEDLNADDAGSYWCKIQKIWILDGWSRDPAFQVKVSVSPAPYASKWTEHPGSPPTSSTVNLGLNHHPGSLLSSIHFWLLVLLKLPLLLSMLSAVLWVNWPLRATGEVGDGVGLRWRTPGILLPGRRSPGTHHRRPLDSWPQDRKGEVTGLWRALVGFCSCALRKGPGLQGSQEGEGNEIHFRALLSPPQVPRPPTLRATSQGPSEATLPSSPGLRVSSSVSPPGPSPASSCRQECPEVTPRPLPLVPGLTGLPPLLRDKLRGVLS